MTSTRIRIPAYFDKPWDSVLIVTYGADLEFFERHLLRQLSKARNRIILADGRQITRKWAGTDGREQLRQVNRTYVVAPIRVHAAAHAKLILLLREDEGLLAVGSGNLSFSGYASLGECFSLYRWSEDDLGQIEEFLAARRFIDQICEQRLVGQIVEERVGQAWQSAPWLYGTALQGDPQVRHNFERSLLDQFVAAIDNRIVEELVVHAPFYDHKCNALAELIQRTSPRRLRVLLQEGRTSVDPGQMATVLEGAAEHVDVRSVNAGDNGTFLHAKFLIARCNENAICLQGSPNISTAALLQVHPQGNIEMANLVVGDPTSFDHLIADLVISREPVDISQLGLCFESDEDGNRDEGLFDLEVADLAWVPPKLYGLFYREVRVQPQIFINAVVIQEATWQLSEPSEGATRFVVTLGEEATESLNQVASVHFLFESGEESAPTFPYHLDILKSLSSIQAKADLLKHAGDFDLGDEELEGLLLQLEEALVIDSRSIWRMRKQKAPKGTEDESLLSMAYEELDWDAIQSHPKLAQYRNWGQASSSDPTPLGILLASIVDRFEADVQRGRSGDLRRDLHGSHASRPDDLDDLAKAIEAEDEEAAEEEESARERRHVTARSRARRHFHSFMRRFVNGLTDDEFVDSVGPSVIVPSYVIFNHLCWKLVQMDIADPSQMVEPQTALWQFIWGRNEEPGYLAALSVEEQEAALDIFDRHHSEAVLLCSLFQANSYIKGSRSDRMATRVRDAWRTILLHPLWQPTRSAIEDSATLLKHECKSAHDLIEKLDKLASFVSDREPIDVVSDAINSKSKSINVTSGQIIRGSLGYQDVPIYAISDPDVYLTTDLAATAINAISTKLMEIDYVRLEDRTNNVVAFADYENGQYIYVNLNTDYEVDLAITTPRAPLWKKSLDNLYEMSVT